MVYSSIHQRPSLSKRSDAQIQALSWSKAVIAKERLLNFADRASKAPFDVTDGIANKIGAATKERGLMTYPSQGCADGINGDHVLLAPSYTSTPEEIALIGETLHAAVADVVGS